MHGHLTHATATDSRQTECKSRSCLVGVTRGPDQLCMMDMFVQNCAQSCAHGCAHQCTTLCTTMCTTVHEHINYAPICVCTGVHICAHLCVQMCTTICIYVCTHVHKCSQVCEHVCTNMCKSLHNCVPKCVHNCTMFHNACAALCTNVCRTVMADICRRLAHLPHLPPLLRRRRCKWRRRRLMQGRLSVPQHPPESESQRVPQVFCLIA